MAARYSQVDESSWHGMNTQASSHIPAARVTYAYAPIATYVPSFADTIPFDINGLPSDIAGIIQASRVFSVRQHIKLMPKHCCVCPPCVKQENTYSVYAGLEHQPEAEFFRIDEVSDDWNRCCCAPFHPFRLEMRQYVPVPGDAVNSSDWEHLKGDVDKDWARFAPEERQQMMIDVYKHYPVLVSAVRDDGQRCCFKCPCKWLSTFVCCQCCMDGMHVFSGEIDDDLNGEKGRPFRLPADRKLGSVQQPLFGGWCWPTLLLTAGREDEPFGRMDGPCCFGGWMEMCMSFKFDVSSINNSGREGPGDIAVIIKKRPVTEAGAMKELLSNADNYSIEFNSPTATVEQKLTILSAQLFTDYIWFDGNTEKCVMDSDGCTCYLWYCSIIGATMPCSFFIPFGNSGSN